MFAAARDATGASEVVVELPELARVRDLRIALESEYPQLAPLLSRAMFAINTHYADEDTPVPLAGEIACIPPVSGG
ncbi:MoaD/ThiS family protein [Bythopirellula polymerisocia]|nr:MoaD/ThiS family protein [Bythopirellula polymerisocia]